MVTNITIRLYLYAHVEVVRPALLDRLALGLDEPGEVLEALRHHVQQRLAQRVHLWRQLYNNRSYRKIDS